MTAAQWFWVCMIGGSTGCLAGIIAYVVISLRELNRDLILPDDRSTDALKPIDMVDPDDPDTWMLALVPKVDLTRESEVAELTTTLRHRGAFLAGNSGRNHRCR